MVIQYSNWPSCELGSPNVWSKSCSVSIRIGTSTGPLAKGPADSTYLIIYIINSSDCKINFFLTFTPGDTRFNDMLGPL